MGLGLGSGAPARVVGAARGGVGQRARELLDFLVPLWAGPVLGASGTQVGLLVGTELAVSVAARPVAGVLADAGERRSVATTGAVLYALSCLGYAAATSMAVALAAAAVGGVGGALFWVAVRAIVGERLRVDAAVYPRLMSWQETGAWVAFIAGLSLLPVLGHRAVFLACAAACLLAALALTVAPPAQLPRTRVLSRAGFSGGSERTRRRSPSGDARPGRRARVADRCGCSLASSSTSQDRALGVANTHPPPVSA
jgi:DHA1 family multidrug resistance protein-like MFS transporter